ncbi:MafI family immunity protein [Rathayibacter toxicus]|uniref:MafI family immunity protein n=1 Tax=Rathayibacter toxicus TaxID=145458 RepID=UPI000A4971DA|nr:MafI family immunity protein [Rathayibacter toxicus]QOD09095.1 MafI family immunity protein [Rathayibacter toxicus]QWL25892.1 MafI family immunity protein [Rathayibacter toxicus]QWL30075.1 MafI family immunity protein [Rathayibacter toxicus]QWL32168.1 MafI family immunity protein [Rathayibacter toxicus]QWL34261.1 MafI family immunity protein [Rathayibacter toxicus]
MSNDTIHPFDAELLQLISSLEGRIAPRSISFAKELVEHGEYQVLLEHIISSLENIGRPLPADILNRIREYSADVNLKKDACKGLRSE